MSGLVHLCTLSSILCKVPALHILLKAVTSYSDISPCIFQFRGPHPITAEPERDAKTRCFAFEILYHSVSLVFFPVLYFLVRDLPYSYFMCSSNWLQLLSKYLLTTLPIVMARKPHTQTQLHRHTYKPMPFSF